MWISSSPLLVAIYLGHHPAVESRHLRGLVQIPESIEIPEPIVCLTAEQCEAKFTTSLNHLTGRFYTSDSYPTKGCFMKNENVYFGTGGTIEEISTTDLPGVQERVYCDETFVPKTTPSPTPLTLSTTEPTWSDGSSTSEPSADALGGLEKPTAEPLPVQCIEDNRVCFIDASCCSGECSVSNGRCAAPPMIQNIIDTEKVVCRTADECEAKFISMNLDGAFYTEEETVNIETRGCFRKNSNVYFGGVGTDEEMSTTDLPGVQERLLCDAPTPTTDSPTKQPTEDELTESPSPAPTEDDLITTESPTVNELSEAPRPKPTDKPVTLAPAVPLFPTTESPTPEPSDAPVTMAPVTPAPQSGTPTTESPTVAKSTDAPTDSLEEQAATTEAPSGQPAPKPVTESPTVSPTGPKKKCRRRLKQGHKGPGDKKPGDKGPKGDKPGAEDKDVGAADDDECI